MEKGVVTTKKNDSSVTGKAADPLSGPLSPAGVAAFKADDKGEDAKEKKAKISPQKFVSISDLIRQATDDDVERLLAGIMDSVEHAGVFRRDRFGRYRPADHEAVLIHLENLWDWRNGDWTLPPTLGSSEGVSDPFDELECYGWHEDAVPPSITEPTDGISRLSPAIRKMSETKVKETYLKAIKALLIYAKLNLDAHSLEDLEKIFPLSKETIRKMRIDLKSV